MAFYTVFNNSASGTPGAEPPAEPPVGAWLILETDGAGASLKEFDGSSPEDGEHVSQWISTGTNTSFFGDGQEDDPGSIEPKYHTTGAINGHPYISAGPLLANLNETDPFSYTWHFLLDVATPVAGRGSLIKTDDGPTIELYIDNGAQVGFSNNGGDHDIAATVAGLQVLTFWWDGTGLAFKIYRNGVQIGVTNNDVPVDGWTMPQPVYFMQSGLGANIPTGTKLVAVRAYQEAQSAPDIASAVAYLMTRGGI